MILESAGKGGSKGKGWGNIDIAVIIVRLNEL